MNVVKTTIVMPTLIVQTQLDPIFVLVKKVTVEMGSTAMVSHLLLVVINVMHAGLLSIFI